MNSLALDLKWWKFLLTQFAPFAPTAVVAVDVAVVVDVLAAVVVVVVVVVGGGVVVAAVAVVVEMC